MKKDQNAEFLKNIFLNAHMAAGSITTLMPKAEKTPLFGELQRQEARYRGFMERACSLLTACDAQEIPEPGIKEKAMVWMGVQWNTLMDSSVTHMAEIMIQGTQMGVTDLTKLLKDHYCCDKPVLQLGEELLQFEKEAAEQLKKYL